MKNVAFAVRGDVLLAVFGEGTPEDAEWEAYLAAYQTIPAGQAKVISFTRGGGPNSSQRMRLQEILQGRAQRCAVITRSRIARAIVSALAWFNPDVRAFAPERLDDALGFLDTPVAARAELLRRADELEAELGEGAVRSWAS
ncbi:MAG TPA: hypothetical protein VEB43_16445 [Anaeromyxobacter sp.]|nr:hypothetical protein [Anaeromyxobacter sp.]